jgi:hypothetical protein
MKTQSAIQAEISQLERSDFEGKIKTLAQRRVVWLRQAAMYLETAKEGFVITEATRIRERLRLIDNQYDLWITSEKYDSLKQRREAYDRMFDVEKLETQLKTLEYLLAD